MSVNLIFKIVGSRDSGFCPGTGAETQRKRRTGISHKPWQDCFWFYSGSFLIFQICLTISDGSLLCKGGKRWVSLRQPASGLQELSWHYNFKIPEKSMGSIWGLRSAFSFFSEWAGICRWSGKLWNWFGSFVKIDAVYLTAMLKILGVTYLAEFAAANLQGCRLSDDRRADRGLCKAQYTCNRNADIKSTASWLIRELGQ